VLKTEQSANEKVTLGKETSNQLFVQNIINIFAVTIILTSGAFDSTFLCQKFYKHHKRPSLYITWDVKGLTFIPATGIVQDFCGIGETPL
jgi:hypothetical protein